MIRRARSTTASMSSVQAPVERYFQPPSGRRATMVPSSMVAATLAAPASTGADAHQRAAGAKAGHEGVDLGAVGPDLRARPGVVGLGVGGVAVLVEEDGVALLGELLGHPDGAVAAFLGRRRNDLGAEDLEELAPLDRHVLRQDHPQPVP